MADKIPQLNNCCFIGTLRIGTTILLILHLIYSAACISAILYQQEEYNKQVERMEAFQSQVEAFNIKIKQINVDNQSYPTLEKIYPFGYWGALVMNAITMVVSIIGLYGVHKKNHPFLVPYLIWEVIFVLSMIAFVLIAISWRLFFAELIPLMIYGYFWLVVFSYYRSLAESITTTNEA